MAESDNLYVDFELRGRFEEQIRQATKDAEKLLETFERIAASSKKTLDGDKLKDLFNKNIAKNAKDGADAIFRMMEVLDKARAAISRNTAHRNEELWGFDDSRLQRSAARLDEIIQKVWGIGLSAGESSRAVKNLLEELDAKLVMTDVKSGTKALVDQMAKEERARQRADEQAKREAKKSEKDDEDAAARNIAAHERVKDALSRIATARSNLSAASKTASSKEAMHARLLMNLLDKLSEKLNLMKKQFLGDKGVLDNVLGSGYQGLMRNVTPAIADLGKLNAEREEQNKKLATTQKQAEALEKVRLDEQSRRNIAAIKGEHAEYDALGRKLVAIAELERKVLERRDDLKRGVKVSAFTKDDLTKELGQIQRQYNEDLARGRAAEEAAANSRRRLASATEQAVHATRSQADANRGLLNTFKEIENAGKRTNKMLDAMTRNLGMYFSFYGIKQILSDVITIGGQFEIQHVALQNILGDVQEANVLFSQLQELAVESPKTMMELTAYAKQLSAYQIPASELYETTKRLADMSSGLGVDMNRLILAYGQVRSAAVLRGQELRQFTEAGIPMVQALANKFTEMNGKLTTTADVFALISKRAVPFEMVKEVLWDMTNQGGQFYNMQAELADTLYGKWQKLKDIWQIILGRMADGAGPMGAMLRMLTESLVFLSSSANTLMPMLAGVGIARATRGARGKWDELYEGQQERTLREYRLAKEKQANMLLRERITMNRELTKGEWEIVRAKGMLTEQDYLMLYNEGRISERKIGQLALDGKINQRLAMRLALMQGYTKEQIKQMANGNLQMLQQGRIGLKERWSQEGPLGLLKSGGKSLLGGISSFLGGPIGIAITAIGAISSAIAKVKADAEELSQKGDAMIDHARTGANNLQKALSAVEADGSTKKRIESLEESLLQLGRTGEAIVANSRKMDDIKARWETLKAGAEEYEQVLTAMGTQEGKALFESAIGGSDIEDYLKDYDDAVNDMYKQHSLIERYSETYKKALSELSSNNAALAEELSGKTLFEQIDLVGLDKLVGHMDDMLKSLPGKNTNDRAQMQAAIAILREHFNFVEDIEGKWNDISEKSIPKMADELRASARSLGIEDLDHLTDKQRSALETLTREYVNSIQEGSVEAKNRLAEELAGQVFKINIVGELTIDKTKLSDFAAFTWDKFGGNGPIGENGKVKIGNKEFTKAQVSTIFGDIDQFKKDYNAEWKKLTEEATNLDKAGATELASARKKEAADVKSVLDAFSLFDSGKNGGGRSGSGSKKDVQLEAAKARLEEVKKFYAEWKKYREQYGDEKARGMVEELFGMQPGEGERIVGDYKSTLRNLLDSLKLTTNDRKKFGLSVRQLLGDMDLEEAKKETERLMTAIKEEMQRQTGQWSLYKELLNTTGDKTFALSAFSDGKLWDEQAEQMATALREEMSRQLKDGGRLLVDWDADDETAKQYFRDNFNGADALYELWKKITELISGNYQRSLTEIASSSKQLAGISGEIVATEQKIAELRRRGASDNDPRILSLEKTLREHKAEQLEQSESYLKFYSGIMAMTVEEAESAGVAIRENLVRQLADGTISADKYLKSLKNIEQQLEKIRSRRSMLGAFVSGGVNGVLSQRQSIAEDRLANATIDVQKLSEEVVKAREAVGAAERKNDAMAILAAKARLTATELELKMAEERREEAEKFLKKIGIETEGLKKVVGVFEMISGAIDGLQQGAQHISDMFAALGQDRRAEGWSDAADIIGIAGSPIKSATNALKSLANGDLGGALSNTVSIFTSPIEGIAKLHDKKLDRAIQKSQKEVKRLGIEYKNIYAEMERVLGGIYTSGGYDEMLENLKRQRDELQKQYEAESDKKDSDGDKLLDYEQQLKELDESIANFAVEMGRVLYGIDLKGWASKLTEAVVSAWERGEDAADAYRSKVKEIVKDLTTNILAKQVMERAFANLGIDKIVAEMIDSSSGKLDASALPRLAEALGQAGNLTVEAITSTLTEMERKGYIERESGGSQSGGSSIKSITESTADLLAAYVNTIRADVSVNRMTLTQILAAVQTQSEMPVIARAQLSQLVQIAGSTARNADAAEMIYELLHRVAPDGTRILVK